MKTSFIGFLLKNKKIVLLIILLIIGVFLCLKLFKKEIINTINDTQIEEEYIYNDGTIRKDTLEKYGLCANENYVIKEEAAVRRTPNVAAYNTIHVLKFGTKIYTKNVDLKNPNGIEIDESLLEREIRNGFVAVYAKKPITLSEMPVGYMAIEDIIEKSEFKNFKRILETTDQIIFPPEIIFEIENHLEIENEIYDFAQDLDRYNNSIVYADFNDDGAKDFAVVIDNSEKTRSAILLFINNLNKQKYDLAYKKSYSSLLKIKTILKDEEVMVNSEKTTFPYDGVLITDTDLKSYFHLYNIDNKSFMVFPN